MKKTKMNELERVQPLVEHATEIMSPDVAQRQAEKKTIIVPKDMDLVEKEALEEAILKYIIEASLRESKDDIVETNPRIAPVRPRPMSDVDEQLIDANQSNIIDVDKLRRLEEICKVPKSVSIEVM